MKYKYILLILFSLTFSLCFAQSPILQLGINFSLTIEDSANVPIVSHNSDGTVTLSHSEQYITDIFAKYKIYDFYQTNPETSPNRFTIVFESKDLINDLYQNVPYEIFHILYPYESTPINLDLINALDGVSLDVLKYNSNPDMLACGSCPPHDVPSDFKLSITFNYDANKDMFYVKSDAISPCGNEFSIGLKGGRPDYWNKTLQLWDSYSVTNSVSDYSQTCHAIEEILYRVLGIFMAGDKFNIYASINSETNHLTLNKTDFTGGLYIIEFSEVSLTVEDQFFKQLNLIQTKGNPFLQISNIGNQRLNIEIYNITGQRIVSTRVFQNNTINISNFVNGIYLIKLSNNNNQQKVFKFLKN